MFEFSSDSGLNPSTMHFLQTSTAELSVKQHVRVVNDDSLLSLFPHFLHFFVPSFAIESFTINLHRYFIINLLHCLFWKHYVDDMLQSVKNLTINLSDSYMSTQCLIFKNLIDYIVRFGGMDIIL